MMIEIGLGPIITVMWNNRVIDPLNHFHLIHVIWQVKPEVVLWTWKSIDTLAHWFYVVDNG
jgi:hypothetical protein